MVGQWDFYQCRLNGKPASVYLDLGLHGAAPDRNRPALLVVRLHLRWPDPANGMSTDAEYDALLTIEDELIEALKLGLGAVYAGRVTTDGRREFFFYAAAASGLQGAAAVPGYRTEAWVQADPQWKHYFDVLYPRGAMLRSIADKAVVETLAARGDRPQVARPITHYAYFANATQRAAFTGSIEHAGFSVHRLTDTGRSADARPFGVVYTLTQGASLAAVSETTGLLMQLAEKHGGEYDGWECPVMGTAKEPWWKFWRRA